MSKDLDDARAKVAWADEHTNLLEGCVAAYLAGNPYRLTPQANAESGGDDLVFQVTEPIPGRLRTTIGAIIHAQRSSLDLLVVVLAERNGAIEPTDTYFLIAKSEQGMSDKRIAAKVRKLSQTDRDIIYGLKPYAGGNVGLYALHWLDLKDKHRKLVTCGNVINNVGFKARQGMGGGYVRRVALYTLGAFKHGDRVAFWDADPQVQLDIAVNVTLSDVPGLPAKPVIETLREFTSLCRSIIDLFD